jgi:hypothetical protein
LFDCIIERLEGGLDHDSSGRPSRGRALLVKQLSAIRRSIWQAQGHQHSKLPHLGISVFVFGTISWRCQPSLSRAHYGPTIDHNNVWQGQDVTMLTHCYITLCLPFVAMPLLGTGAFTRPSSLYAPCCHPLQLYVPSCHSSQPYALHFHASYASLPSASAFFFFFFFFFC